MMPNFKLGVRSLQELEGVHGDLVLVVKRAIEITPIDFSVVDGLRTLEEQKVYVAKGASHTLKSRHLTGHAVDLVGYIGNKVRWETELLCKVATAMRAAAQELDVSIRWGGNWDVDLKSTEGSTEDLIQDYIRKRLEQGKKPFVDAPHYELPALLYPQ
jgi:peptidoglycan L-alanyl-D-glutamate endopeptidase CwlK